MTTLPLTRAQERLWFLQRLNPADASYQISHTVRLLGPLDTQALARAFREIVARHDALRARFPAEDGVPVQVIDPPGDFELRTLTCAGPVEPLVDDFVTRPFDLTRDRLLRAVLIETGPQEHVLSLVAHHIVFDGRSMGLLLAELSALYAAFAAGRPSPLEPPRASWAEAVGAGDDSGDADALKYWLERLAGVPPLVLPTDRPRPAVAGTAGLRYRYTLPKRLSDRFAAFATAERCTPFMALFAAYQVLLAGRSGQRDFCVGFPTAGRARVEDEQVIGYFANTAVLRCDLSGDPAFRTLLRRVRSRLLEAHRHRRVPLELLLTELDVERDLSRPPLFQTMFGMIYSPSTQGVRLPGVEVQWVEAGRVHSPFELTFDVFEMEGEWQLVLVYDRDLFDEETIAGYVADYESLLDRILDDPEARLSRLTAPQGAERHRLLQEWNRTAPPARELFPDLFRAQVALRPDAVAAGCGPVRLSYAELDRRAGELAARLGPRPGERVAVCLPRSVEALVALLAVQRTGAAYVPLDPGYPPARLALVLEDCGASLVLADAATAAALPPGAPPVLLVDDPAGPPPEPFTPVPVRGGDIAYVLYTSGSTGRPKGVMVPHSALGNLLAAMRDLIGATPRDVWLALTSLSFDISALELYLPLAVGGRVEIADTATAADGFALVRLIGRAGVTHVQATPSGWRVLLESGLRDPELTALAGGEALGRELAVRLRAATGRLLNVYGPTETTIWSTAWEVPADPREVRIGGPIGGTRVYVVGEHGEPVRPGAPGELLIGGAGVAQGYLGRPGLTAERFVPDPYGPPGGRLYRTGDLVRWDRDGALEFLGRNDDQVKLHGHRIELGEVEAACEALPGVQAAVAAVREESLVAYIVGDAEPEGLRAALAERLPGYLVPTRFVRLAELPLTPNGKVDRRALPAPEALRAEFVAPRTDAEQLVAEVWAEALGLTEVGVCDDFFRLGGHSLIAARINARLRQHTGVELPLRTLFTHRTVAEYAAAVEECLLAELAELSEEEAQRLLEG